MNQYWSDAVAVNSVAKNAKLTRIVRLRDIVSAYYYRLRAAGKRPKVAMIATMRKLLAAVYSIAKNRRPFDAQLNTPAVYPPLGGGAGKVTI
jgi:hypothetical protein